MARPEEVDEFDGKVFPFPVVVVLEEGKNAGLEDFGLLIFSPAGLGECCKHLNDVIE